MKEELTGDLTLESFLSLRAELTAHTFMLFKDRKEELMLERIEAYKAKNWDLYKEKIQQASHDFYQLSAEEMRFALNFLDISPENYSLTMQKVMQEPNIQKMCEENDMELRARLEHKDLTQSRDEIKKIHLEVMLGESEVAKMATMENKAMQLFEKTKLYDKIYQEHGVKIHQLQSAVKKHGIDQDKDVVETSNAIAQQAQEAKEKLAEENKLTAETSAGIAKDIAALPPCPEKGRPQILNFDFWLALFRCLQYHVNRESFFLRQQQKADRRKVLKEQGIEAYNQIFAQHTKAIQMRMGLVNNAIF